jgi:hypothetical protein
MADNTGHSFNIGPYEKMKNIDSLTNTRNR